MRNNRKRRTTSRTRRVGVPASVVDSSHDGDGGKPVFAVVDGAVRIPAKPLEVFRIMTDPSNRKVFKNIVRTVSRNVVESNVFDGTRVVEVEQVGRWRFLGLRGTFDAKVSVTEMWRSWEAHYRLHPAKRGFMRHFSGRWKVLPLLCKISSSVPSEKDRATTCEVLPASQIEKANESLVITHQEIQPRFIPPSPLAGYFRSIARNTSVDILRDLAHVFCPT